MLHRLLVTAILLVLVFSGSMATAQMPNPYGAPISLENAKKAAAAAIAEARKNNWTMAVAVTDTAGTLVYFERIDATQVASSVVAINIARSAPYISGQRSHSRTHWLPRWRRPPYPALGGRCGCRRGTSSRRGWQDRGRNRSFGRHECAGRPGRETGCGGTEITLGGLDEAEPENGIHRRILLAATDAETVVPLSHCPGTCKCRWFLGYQRSSSPGHRFASAVYTIRGAAG